MDLELSKIDQEAADNFRFQAREFCNFIEGCTHLDPSTLVHTLTPLILRICLAGFSLPQVKLGTTGDDEYAASSADEHSKEWAALATRLRKQLSRYSLLGLSRPR
jgi:hypothetical protein